ncbi:hypothetical protein C5167_044938 [Papaver somniferum]|uniref:AN1-type domain-containing protein n=1 Tax=Papaver somniferum TaxID=3469 RepID=A0A4Y7LCZ9_PAPSO|nr:zinc finger A20 and AN1 domain-containing stress-associated protein 5-like [Papaver somniferum]XP_026425678.1 zinc finger A20 and AN1 domain-containing stress-associated protein 5-like [Papaver somniferum]RZC82151.1 hypothetical protein C5167_044938 [Papaver somniferum]
MAEEQRCQAQPEGHILCANNCGFFGSPATLNLCSKCYRDHRLTEEQASSAKFAVEKSLAGPATIPSPSSSPATATTKLYSEPALVLPSSSSSPSSSEFRNPSPVVANPVVASPAVAAKPNRCLTCNKRVGLTGFKCKCGITFCSTHRYPEQHGCTFDYKAVGRDAIIKANPIVKAEKLENKI